MAEAMFRHMVDEAGLSECVQTASAATSRWEIGEPIHPGTRDVLRLNNIPWDRSKRAVQVTREDFKNYPYIIVMDNENVDDLQRAGLGPVRKLMDFAPHLGVKDVPDPYYTHNFDYVFQLVKAGCRGLLAHIREQEGL